jgi:hypothetical protein
MVATPGAARILAVAIGVAAAPAIAERQPAPGRAERVEYRDPDSVPARGPTTALVTIELFFVPGPAMPTAALRLLQQLADRHATRVRLVYRILKSGSAVMLPSAALAAHAEGKFFELMDELARQRTALKKEELLELARRVGIDPQRERYREVLAANQRRLERLHASNPPSVLFNSRPSKLALAAGNMADFEREYQAAYDRALDKLERGFAPGELGQAFDDEAMLGVQPVVITPSAADEDGEASLLDHPLATPLLPLGGLPSFGSADAARVPIVVLCRPNDPACSNLLRVIEPEVRLYPDDVRLVWAPWFDVGRDDAAELTLLGDAALCAEAIGSNHGELTSSPGWVWVKETYAQWSATRGPKLPADRLLDAVSGKLAIDRRALSACRARLAGATLRWIATARHAGVPRTNTAVLIGGRIYAGLSDQTQIHALVEAELAPGVLGVLPRWPPAP